MDLQPWTGPWEPDDPDAVFKAGLSAHTGIPVDGLVRYVLARFATTGSGGLLELGPAMVERLREPVRRAEAEGTDEARLVAYRELAGMLSWLAAPLDDPEVYPG
jgi:hypothetical protein